MFPPSSDPLGRTGTLSVHPIQKHNRINRINDKIDLVTKKLISSDPTKGRKYEKVTAVASKSEAHLTVEEVDRLISCSKTEDVKGYRDCAMLETLYATGLKTGEFLNLRTDDVHLKEGYLTVEADGHTRYVPLYRGAVSAIRV